jgi:8-oxo-dGTP pyrophosphatase MutT (NUDIX family)
VISDWDPDATPAATVVLLRDGPAALEVLMLRRDAGLAFAGGAWVFPGGRIDPADHGSGGDDDLERSARHAASREAFEEAGVVVDPDHLVRWSHWTPPPESPRRFSTAFFVAAATDGWAPVVVDDAEIREHRWTTAADALGDRDSGGVTLTQPTFITLQQLLPHRRVADALAWAAGHRHEHFATRVVDLGGTLAAVYHGDVRYDSGAGIDTSGGRDDHDPEQDRPRHRLLMGDRWRYVRDPDTIPGPGSRPEEEGAP